MRRFSVSKLWRVLSLTGWTLYAYVFMEWLFFATIPSFMSSMSLLQKAGVLFLSAFMLGLPIVVLAAVLAFVSSKLAAGVPALVLSLLALILLDNFTYTLFKIGIVTSTGAWRAVYAVGLAAALVLLWRRISARLEAGGAGQAVVPTYVLLALGGLSLAIFLVNVPKFHVPTTETATSSSDSDLPNIILIGIDGVDATHTSLFGYERDTTPNIARLAPQALVAENALSNAGKTGGSLTSLLTGKPSTETRVLFPPDILLGEDAYQHLPGILKQRGYHTVQITMQYYGDAYERNLREGFDVDNGRSQADYPLLAQFARLGGGGSAYFAGEMLVRITERLEHIFFIRTMQNPYAAVTQPKFALHDDQRIADMFRYLDVGTSPLFLHIHLMDTHGPEFYVPRQHFSQPGEKNDNWNTDYYDDAILNSDAYIGDLFRHLEQTGQRNNTLVILYSDHGLDWSTLDRVPLLFWFPQQRYAGSIQANVQLLDVAPTILDYLGISQPSWMSGRSILAPDLPMSRPIYSAIVNDRLLRVTDDRTTWVVNEAEIKPPFFQLGKLDLVVCDRWYSLDLDATALTYGHIPGSTAACGDEETPSPAQAARLIVEYLKKARYDVGSLPADIPSQASP